MLAPLFAIMTSWVGILFLLVLAALAWLFLKAGADLVTWFREEVLDDPYRRRRAAKKRREA